jgi:proline-specific peptidase
MRAFYRRHVCRLEPWPECLQRAFEKLALDVYRAMFGPSEFYATGTLRDWDVTARLPQLDVPTLVLSGRHDEAIPAVMAPVHRGIRGSRWRLFEASAHMAHLEEPEAFQREVRGFLRAHEGR